MRFFCVCCCIFLSFRSIFLMSDSFKIECLFPPFKQQTSSSRSVSNIEKLNFTAAYFLPLLLLPFLSPCCSDIPFSFSFSLSPPFIPYYCHRPLWLAVSAALSLRSQMCSCFMIYSDAEIGAERLRCGRNVLRLNSNGSAHFLLSTRMEVTLSLSYES